MNEEIARLTGKLVFDVQTGPLHQLLRMLKSAEVAMTRAGKQAEALQAKLNKVFGINGKGTGGDRLKASAAYQRSLDKEFTLEQKHARVKEAVFRAQLAQQKLVSAGTREQAFLQTAALKAQQAQAVAAAKEQKLLQEKLRTKQGEAKVTATLQQAKLREAKLQDVLIRRQERSQQLQRQELSHATALQRAEHALVTARQRGIQLAEKHATSQAAIAAREARATEKHQFQAQRFAMTQERHASWKSRDAQPESMGLGGLALGLSGATAALYGLVRGVGYLNERVTQRQEGVVEAQGFNNMFMSISRNPEIVKSYREAFIKSQMDNGGLIDTETSKDFRTLAINMAAAGKSQATILETWNTRQKAFAVAGTTKDDNRELNKQLGQMASDGTGAASDANIINDRLPMLTPYVVREYMKEKGIRKYTDGLAKYNKDLKGGKGVRYTWYEKAMDNLVKDNEPSLERNRNSVAAQQQRAENQAYLGQNNINSDQELASVIGERIRAERELNEALQPLQQTLASFDLGLTQLTTQMLRFGAGRNTDGTMKPEQQRMQERMSTGDTTVDTAMVGTHDYSDINGSTHRQGGPIGKFYNWLLDLPDYSKGDAEKLKVPVPSSLTPVIPSLDTSKLDSSQLPKHLEELMQTPLMKGLARMAVEDADRSPQATGIVTSTDAQRASTVNNTITNVKTINNSPVINVSVTSDKNTDDNELAKKISLQVNDALKMQLQHANAALGSESQ
ncbi:hypothetical protein OC610_00875 [Pseudomonas sp. SAICEU22]|uniref:Uncharacterized protein n=1 Tax=Pseudomonas agronomica TaxID=2979328 RepID=A0ABT3F1I0_9PSED|nr:hypothetical protein [Pseudomonas agronomica]MCW1242947.1 hypothetical protein [Pseudomonas agronomica]